MIPDEHVAMASLPSNGEGGQGQGHSNRSVPNPDATPTANMLDGVEVEEGVLVVAPVDFFTLDLFKSGRRWADRLTSRAHITRGKLEQEFYIWDRL